MKMMFMYLNITHYFDISNVPRELYSIDVAATFGVPLTTVGDLQKLINDIDAGKHDELLSELTNEDRMKTLEALGFICNSIKVDRNNVDVIPCKFSYADDSINLNVDESTIPSDPIVQSVDINKSTSYVGVAGGSAKDQPNVNSNFRTLVGDPVFDGVNISIPRKVVEKVNTRFEHTLYGYFMERRMAFVVTYYAPPTQHPHTHTTKQNKLGENMVIRIMRIPKAYFSIILIPSDCLKEELTRIPIWVKLHDVPIQVFEEDGISLIAMFIGVSWMLFSIGIPSFFEDDFYKDQSVLSMNWSRRDVLHTNAGFPRFEPKATTSAPKKGTTYVGYTSQSTHMLKTTGNSSKKDNLSMSNYFCALNEEEEDDEEEDVENVYDESANLIQNTKADGSSSFTAAAGYLHAGCDCANEVPRGPDVGVDPNARFCPNGLERFKKTLMMSFQDEDASFVMIRAGRFADVATGAESIVVSVVLPGTGLIRTKMARRTGSIDEFEFKAIGENQTKVFVNEMDTLGTRRSKEWKDKLPNVVLKAEEIVYSKANSEDRWYMRKRIISIAIDSARKMMFVGKELEACIELISATRVNPTLRLSYATLSVICGKD
ncbi:hypothetical protein Tco_0206463 [Tanacetum coccineum]